MIIHGNSIGSPDTLSSYSLKTINTHTQHTKKISKFILSNIRTQRGNTEILIIDKKEKKNLYV